MKPPNHLRAGCHYSSPIHSGDGDVVMDQGTVPQQRQPLWEAVVAENSPVTTWVIQGLGWTSPVAIALIHRWPELICYPV